MNKNDQFTVVYGWMSTELGLTPAQVLIYAVIYGFSRHGEDVWFNGTAKYLADFCGVSQRTVFGALKEMVEKGILEKRTIVTPLGVKFCHYRHSEAARTRLCDEHDNSTISRGGQPYTPAVAPADESAQCQPCDSTMGSTTPDLPSVAKAPAPLAKSKAFRPPTLEEVSAYCAERANRIDAQHFIDYYTSKGWVVGRSPMRDWKAAVRTWERNGFNAEGPTQAEVIAMADAAFAAEEEEYKRSLVGGSNGR